MSTRLTRSAVLCLILMTAAGLRHVGAAVASPPDHTGTVVGAIAGLRENLGWAALRKTIETAPEQTGVTVETTEGPVVGVAGAEAVAWKGIAFAAPPVGALRWRAPQPPAAHAQPFQASTFAKACPQTEPDFRGNRASWDEDCLKLNIWSPSTPAEGGRPWPVMVWIHGGGFVQGDAADPLYDGANLSSRGAVVVSLQYRLGALGFLAHKAFFGQEPALPGAGNYGLLDQIAALHWVRANIHGFGGDPERISIFGESAGGVSVCALLASPLAGGLFGAAIMESGNCRVGLPDLDQPRGAIAPATRQGERFADAIGCSGAPDVAACMRAKPAEEVLQTLPGSIGILNPGAEVYGPILDGTTLVMDPGQAVREGAVYPIPFLLGANADEGTLFTRAYSNTTAVQVQALVRSLYGANAEAVLQLYPISAYPTPAGALAAMVGDQGFVCPARRSAREHAGHGHSAYLYHFTHVTAVGERTGLGSHHGAELPFVFGTLGSRLMGADEKALGAAMQGYWIDFAATGVPGTQDGLTWPSYRPDADMGLEFATPNKLTQGWRDAKCDLWDRLSDRDLPGPGPSPTSAASATAGATPVPTSLPSAVPTLRPTTAPTAISTARPTQGPPSGSVTPPTSGAGRAFLPWLANRGDQGAGSGVASGVASGAMRSMR